MLFDSPPTDSETMVPDLTTLPVSAMQEQSSKPSTWERDSVPVAEGNGSKSHRSSSKSTSPGSVGMCSQSPPPTNPSPPALPPAEAPTVGGRNKAPHHVLYSHTHKPKPSGERPITLEEDRANGNSSSTAQGQGLSLRGEGSKVRYREVSRPRFAIDLHKEQCQGPSAAAAAAAGTNGESSPTSPSILSSEAPLGRGVAVSEPPKAMGVSAPGDSGDQMMSCSMFTTVPTDTDGIDHTPTVTIADDLTTLGSPAVIQTPKRPNNPLVDQIATRLRTKESPVATEPEVDGAGAANIVPVTPGVKSVESMRADDRWMKSGHQRDSTAAITTKPSSGEDCSSSATAGSVRVPRENRTKRLATGTNGGTHKLKLKQRAYNVPFSVKVIGAQNSRKRHSEMRNNASSKRLRVAGPSDDGEEEEEEGEEGEEVILVSVDRRHLVNR